MGVAATPRRIAAGQIPVLLISVTEYIFNVVYSRMVKKSIMGVHPLGCLPLWGREGVTIAFYKECKRDDRIGKI
jgi:hypothetical protein